VALPCVVRPDNGMLPACTRGRSADLQAGALVIAAAAVSVQHHWNAGTRAPSAAEACEHWWWHAGKLSRKAGITWSSPPAAVLADVHYVVALQAGAVEVAPVSRLAASKVVQAEELPGMELALGTGPAQDGSLYAASGKDAGVWCCTWPCCAGKDAAVVALGDAAWACLLVLFAALEHRSAHHR
jgi:hypothetical protein